MNEGRTRHDEANWAAPVRRLSVTAAPAGAIAATVDGKRVAGPLQGFGWMWQKTFRVRLPATRATPRDVIRTWKARFTEFWPKGNRFFAPIAGIQPGEVALLSVRPLPGAPVKLSTGVLVLYADEESFTLMTPQGHMLAGWITFSAYAEGEDTVAQAQLLVRTSDPLYEAGMLVFGSKHEDRFWQHTLRSLARAFDRETDVETQVVCVDRAWQWSNAKNVWQNAGIRGTLYSTAAPIRWLRSRARRSG